MEYYGNNDWRDYHLSHHGILGMKWGVRKQRPVTGGGRSLSDFVRKKIGRVGTAMVEREKRKRNKAISKYKKKYKLTDRQANVVYDYGKSRGYSKKKTQSVAKYMKNSYGNVKVADTKARTVRYAKRAVTAYLAVAALGTPEGRRATAKGALVVGRLLGKTVKATARAARATTNAAGKATQRAKDTYWHFNPKHAPKQSVVDAVWREVSSDPIRRRALGNVPRLTMK